MPFYRPARVQKERYMIIFIFAVLSEQQRELVEKLFQEHHEQFQRISLKIVNSEADAEDVVSAVYIKIIDNIEKISELPCPRIAAFCVTMVKNTSIDMIRRSKKLVSTDDLEMESTDPEDDVESICIRNADVQKLAKLVSGLSDDDRRLLQLRYEQELGFSDISELLGISEENAKKRAQRLVKKLKAQYGEE